MAIGSGGSGTARPSSGTGRSTIEAAFPVEKVRWWNISGIEVRGLFFGLLPQANEVAVGGAGRKGTPSSLSDWGCEVTLR